MKRGGIDYASSTILNTIVNNIVKGLQLSIIEDAKKEVLETLKNLENELIELSLEYTTGMKLKKEE